MSDDSVSIIACLKTSDTKPDAIWKTLSDTSPSNLNIVKITTTLCKWGGTYTIIAQCPDGYELLGCGGGEGDLLESKENWFLDLDYGNRNCVGHISQPACDGAADQAVVVASCYKP